MAVDSLQTTAKTAAAADPRKAFGRPFQKGESGNPAGRPRGSRNRNTLAAELLLEDEALALTRKAIELALAGDPTALKLCFDSLHPRRRERSVQIALPPLRNAFDPAPVMAAVAESVADGRVTPGEAFELSQVVETAIRAIAGSEAAARWAEHDRKPKWEPPPQAEPWATGKW